MKIFRKVTSGDAIENALDLKFFLESVRIGPQTGSPKKLTLFVHIF